MNTGKDVVGVKEKTNIAESHCDTCSETSSNKVVTRSDKAVEGKSNIEKTDGNGHNTYSNVNEVNTDGQAVKATKTVDCTDSDEDEMEDIPSSTVNNR